MKYLIAALICLGFAACTVQSPGSGRKIGRIVKLSQDGMVFKTWEGELIRGGFNDGTGSMGQTFRFTIEEEQLIDAAVMAFENQIEVIIDYECEFITGIWRSERGCPHFIKDINFSR